jgi:hypothetical protein
MVSLSPARAGPESRCSAGPPPPLMSDVTPINGGTAVRRAESITLVARSNITIFLFVARTSDPSSRNTPIDGVVHVHVRRRLGRREDMRSGRCHVAPLTVLY